MAPRHAPSSNIARHPSFTWERCHGPVNSAGAVSSAAGPIAYYQNVCLSVSLGKTVERPRSTNCPLGTVCAGAVPSILGMPGTSPPAKRCPENMPKGALAPHTFSLSETRNLGARSRVARRRNKKWRQGHGQHIGFSFQHCRSCHGRRPSRHGRRPRATRPSIRSGGSRRRCRERGPPA